MDKSQNVLKSDEKVNKALSQKERKSKRQEIKMEKNQKRKKSKN